jgi:hypothetical protein
MEIAVLGIDLIKTVCSGGNPPHNEFRTDQV